MAIEQKQLDGLVYTTAKRKEVAENGSRRVTYMPVERPLKTGDILSETEHDGFTTIVTGDGRKYDIPAVKKTGGKKNGATNESGGNAEDSPDAGAGGKAGEEG